MIARHVRELVVADDITRSEHALVRGAEPRVHRDALGRSRDAGPVEPKLFDIDLTAGRDQEMRPLDCASRPCVDENDGDTVSGLFDPRDGRCFNRRDPFFRNLPRTTSTAAGSSFASICAASMSVTAAPRRRCAWAISQPIGPAPITMRCAGRTSFSKMVSLVKKGRDRGRNLRDRRAASRGNYETAGPNGDLACLERAAIEEFGTRLE